MNRTPTQPATDGDPLISALEEERQLTGAQGPDGIGQLVGDFVHELNNLLAVIKNNAVFVTQDLKSVLGGDSATTARMMKDVGQISLATDRAIRLTDQLSASAVVTSDERMVPAGKPVHREGSAQQGPRAARLAVGSTGSMTASGEAAVLIVDDDEQTGQTLVRILERSRFDGRGCRCTTVSSAAEARRALRESPWDLMLCDGVMPGQNGLSLLRHIKSEWSSVPVVMILAVDSAEDAQAALDSGYYAYIAKPYSDNQVRIAVANALRWVELERENGAYSERLQTILAECTAVRPLLVAEHDGHALSAAGQGRFGLLPNHPADRASNPHP